MKQLKHADYKMILMEKVDLYKSIRGRLVGEVGVILRLIKDYNQDPKISAGDVIGYWSGIRMLMPIIEILADIEGMKDRGEFLNKYLNFQEIGNITWEMFRDSLLHGDLPYTLEYKGSEIIWSIHFQNIPQFVYIGTKTHPPTNVICIMKLYEDLVRYLDSEISKNDRTQFNVAIGLVYNERVKTSIKNEFEKIKKKIAYL